jgi:hypothetical protein
MIGILKQLEGCARTELFGERFKKLQVRELITGSLQEKHRDFYIEEMLATLVRQPPGRMQRESEKHETADAG